MEAHDRKQAVNRDVSKDEHPTIAILGAGIGGLALAIGLIKRGVSCTVYEAATEFSAIGAGIGLGPNSLQAMDLIDPRFRMKYDDVKTGNERPEFENCIYDALYAEQDFGERRGWTRGVAGASYFTRSSAHRKDLLKIVESFIPEGTIRFSKRASEVRQNGGSVTVQFQDGEAITADAVIGCDGVKGITRRVVLESIAPEPVSPEYTGTYIYRGILPMTNCKDILGKHGGDAKWFMAKDKGVVIYPISKGTEANFVFFISDPAPWTHESNAIACSKEEMVADLEGFDLRLVKLLEWANPLKYAVYHIRNTPTYFNRGSVYLAM